MKLGRLLLAAAVLMAACAQSPVAIKRGYDFRLISRVAILGFSDYPTQIGSGDVISSIFEKYLLKAGYDVVERREVDRLLKEQSFTLSGAVDPATAQQLGHILGVDALILGTITEFVPETSQIVPAQPLPDNYIPTHRRYDNNYRSRRPDLGPQTVLTDAKVGLAARMVDVATGSVLWIGSDDEVGSNIEDCADSISGKIMKGLKSIWPLTLLKKRK
jgi:hypothetical protein